MSTLLYFNFMIVLMALFLWGSKYVLLRYSQFISPRKILRVARLLLITLWFLPLLPSVSDVAPIKIYRPKAIEDWQKEIKHISDEQYFLTESQYKVALNVTNRFGVELFLYLYFLGCCLLIFKKIIQVLKLMELKKSSLLLKKYNNASVYITSKYKIPFAFWLPRNTCVFLPDYMLLNLKNMKLALAHEIQHHKNGDTKWVYYMELLKILFFYNLFIYLLMKMDEEIQEIVCDEVLIGHKKVSSFDYANCLLWVVRKNVNNCSLPFGTTAMGESSSSKKLKQRIEHMKWYQVKKTKLISKAPMLAALILLTSSLYAKVLITEDRGLHLIGPKNRDVLTLVDGNKLVQKVEQNSSFPLEMNKYVLDELNFYLKTAKGKIHTRDSLRRKKDYDEVFSDLFKRHGLPRELIAIGFVESGFLNLSQGNSSAKAAGIWQFIPSTARKYNLIVNENLDERLDVKKETQAAIDYLKDLKEEFDDWRLAVLAYYAGSYRIKTAISELNSKDPWRIIKGGYLESNVNYLAKIMASIIILKHSDE